jgi:hypothetical protein
MNRSYYTIEEIIINSDSIIKYKVKEELRTCIINFN